MVDHARKNSAEYWTYPLFFVDSPPEVRLNEEVKAVFKARATRPLEKGEMLTSADFDNIEGIELTDLDPNAGHLTMLLHRGAWHLVFDFRYNAARISEHIDAAREFLDCSAYCLEKGHLRSLVENLFSATELMAKGQLLMLPDENMLTTRKHSIVSGKYNWWGRLGNTDPRFVALLNRLWNLRPPARYLRGDLEITESEARSMYAVADEMFNTLHASVPTRFRVTRDDS